MVLQDNAATTRDKYICKLVEVALYDGPTPDISTICKKIDNIFGLTFDTVEVSNALKRKGTNRIIYDNGVYSLSIKVERQLRGKLLQNN